MNLSKPHPLTRQTRIFPGSIAVALALFLAGCGPCVGPSGGGDGKAVKTTATRAQSEFDYYCGLRPTPSGERGLSKENRPQPFAPTVYAAMRARGYKVYLVQYRWEHTEPAFFPVVTRGLPAGYGLRDFFGSPTMDTVATQPAARSAATNNNASAEGRAGYGFRNFFGPEPAATRASRTDKGTRTAVVWETRRGEFFLVDHYYATPIWLDGKGWLEMVRFYDPAAVSVEVMKS